MKKCFALFLSALIFSCGEVQLLEAPDYEDISRIVTSKGKTLETTEWLISVPEGAIDGSIILPDPRVESVQQFMGLSSLSLPPFMFASNDKFIKYKSIWTFYPRDLEFKKEVTLGFAGTQKTDQFIYEFKSGTDSTKAENWVNKTHEFTSVRPNILGIKSNSFKRYLVTDGYYDDVFYMDTRRAIDFPYSSRKPVSFNGKYRATIIDVNGEIYLLYILFVDPPVANQRFTLYDASVSGQLNNTSNQYAEIEAGFSCFFSGGSVTCSQRFVSKSGTIKYLIEQNSDGTFKHRILFRDVVIKQPSTGAERKLNGFYQLRLN